MLVATPGRLLDLVDQRVLDLSALEILVLDEADQMLDLGFIHALKRIVKLIPAKRQTLFFSATMPKTIRQLADAYLTNPAEVAVTPVATTVERIKQAVTHVNQAEKQALLTLVLQKPDVERALVFSRTKHGADKIVRFLEAAGIKSNAIHGNKSQGQRERALGLFRSGDVKVLIATDIAARGIDIPGVSHVVNFDLPDVPEQYVHRIGRTARAGASGQAIAFCSRDERVNLKDIEKLDPDQAARDGASGRLHGRGRGDQAPQARAQADRQPRASAARRPPLHRRPPRSSPATSARRSAPRRPACRTTGSRRPEQQRSPRQSVA